MLRASTLFFFINQGNHLQFIRPSNATHCNLPSFKSNSLQPTYACEGGARQLHQTSKKLFRQVTSHLLS
jgi:hypothetical protein